METSKIKPMKASIPKLIITLLSLTLVYTSIAQETTGKGESPNIIVVEVSINQPNVEDCYTTSIDDLIINEEWLKVYPNPSHGNFTLEISQLNPNEKVLIKIFSSSGQNVFFSNLKSISNSLTKEIDLGSAPKGFYIIHIQINNRKITRKLTII